jgi:hypothetical protein
MRTLIAPPAAANAESAVEVARVWVINQALQCSLDAGVWKDPAAWGIVLADMARHIANAHHEADGLSVSQTLQRIREGFEAEMDSPTDSPTGRFA